MAGGVRFVGGTGRLRGGARSSRDFSCKRVSSLITDATDALQRPLPQTSFYLQVIVERVNQLFFCESPVRAAIVATAGAARTGEHRLPARQTTVHATPSPR